ncbi:MAG: helix-turn-helix transcriptional regulator, partial [Methylomicrobium sp.]|nr:helix-turn-helix transcriptional regulator [Methylomicrobium sp.]
PQQPTGAKTIESNAEWLGGFETWDNDTPLRDDEVELPFFREVELAAGNGRSEIIENHGLKLRFAKSTLKKQNVDPASAACVTVSGNSMEPVLPDGATIGIDTSKRQIKDGDIYAIDHDGHLRVKVLYRLPGGKVRLRSFNSDEWPDELVTQDEFKILGRVFWWSVLR